VALVVLTLVALPSGTASADSSSGSVPSCTAAALKAVRLRITLNVLPAGCRGLTSADLERAVAAAVGSVADHGPKLQRRRLAALANARLGYLISVAKQGQSRPHLRPRSIAAPPAGPGPRLNIGVGAAALVAWLLTAATGGWLLLGWLRHGGPRRTRRPPPVILTHIALATAGLLTWITYLATSTPAVAWLAAALLLPVAGLGMATLIQAIPESAPRTASGGRAASTASTARMPVVTITVHGACATATLLLVLLAAIGAR
jgi:hypothetical protein